MQRYQIGPNFPVHHASPHTHAVNAAGDEIIIKYPSGS